jgi:hypothetical protein
MAISLLCVVMRWLESFMMLPVTIETIFINWDKVTDIRINKGELLYYVQGFTNPLLASEVLHFKNFTRRNRRRGRNNLWRTAIISN